MSNPKYLLNKTGSEVDNILSNAELHMADDSIHVTQEEKAKLDEVDNKANLDLTNVDNTTFKSKVEASGFSSGTQAQIIT